MNGRDMIAVLEYVKAFNKPEKENTTRRFRKSNKDLDDIDIYAMIQKKRQEAKMLEEWIKDMEKIHKKEEKKEESKGVFGKMTVLQRTVWLTVLGPPLGLLYMTTMLMLFKEAAKSVGAM